MAFLESQTDNRLYQEEVRRPSLTSLRARYRATLAELADAQYFMPRADDPNMSLGHWVRTMHRTAAILSELRAGGRNMSKYA